MHGKGRKAREKAIRSARTRTIFRSVVRARQGHWHLRKSRMVIDIQLTYLPADGGSIIVGRNRALGQLSLSCRGDMRTSRIGAGFGGWDTARIEVVMPARLLSYG